MTLNQEMFAELVTLVGKKLEASVAEGGEFSLDNYDAYSKRVRAAEAKLVDFFTAHAGARWSSKGSDFQVTMAGIRSTSTSGWTSALRNWRVSAEKKLGAPR